MSLCLQNLIRHYGGVKALDGVSFEIQSGQCVALIGPNGAGKSTCFACLAGQQVPDAGQVFWQQQDVTRLTPVQRQVLGMARLEELDLYNTPCVSAAAVARIAR